LIYRGIAKGKKIELEEPLPYPNGQLVQVSVAPLTEQPDGSWLAMIRRAIHEEPHLKWEDVDELERIIQEGGLPVLFEGVFDRDSR
jgi:hypothetical protein